MPSRPFDCARAGSASVSANPVATIRRASELLENMFISFLHSDMRDESSISRYGCATSRLQFRGRYSKVELIVIDGTRMQTCGTAHHTLAQQFGGISSR